MGFTRKTEYYLVHYLPCSNKEARQLIQQGLVQINGKTISDNPIISETDELKVTGRVIKPAKQFEYYKFYKPRGFESTMNPGVPGNISVFFDPGKQLSIAGRLDKASEGLLLLSNDGKWVEDLCRPASFKEKEYLVQLDKIPDEIFFQRFQAGIILDGSLTRPCQCFSSGETGIRVILAEGRYRQIRRMCHKLGYGVTELKRIRIDAVWLGDLSPGKYQPLL